MNNSTFRSKLPPVLLLYFLTMIGFQVAAQSGKVFRDYNADGVKQATEPLIAGVIVKAYTAANAECATTTTTTVADGSGNNYSLTGCSGSVRVEFTIPDTGCGLNPAVDYTSGGGTAYGSSVQFVTSSSTNVNFAVNAPEDYFTSADNPKIYVPCYVNGDPANTNVGAADAFVGVKYDASAPTDYVASVGEIGSTWGVAYSKQARKIFTGAFLKRHVGLGPLGSGGIYMIDPVTNTVTNWLNLDNIGIATQGSGTYAGSGPSASSSVAFTDVIGTNTQRNLGNGLDQPSHDAPAFAQIGKVSLGDIDISDDGRYLFVMNLYDKTVYRIDLVDPANPQAPTSANVGTRVTSWAVPSPGCTNGTHRPFALEFARGNLFVGLVCTAESGGTNADLDAYVYQVTNFTAGTYSTLFTIPLDYNKGTPFTWSGTQAQDGWFPWTDNAATIRVSGNNIYPQPVLCDIVFDADGSLIMSFFDRNGHQSGWYNYQPDNTELKLTVIGGDLLRAYYNPSTCTYELESNGKEGVSSTKAATAGAGNSQGPGGGEFYFKDCYKCTGVNGTGDPHEENVQGGIAMALGSGEVAVAVIDPVRFDSGGLTWFNNTTGVDGKDYELYYTGNINNLPPSGTFSKANGLGDLEVSGSAAPIEIGNRIWKDTDKDGIQDAGEDGVDGVEIELYEGTSATGSPVQTKTSATLAGQKGSWYFTNLKANQDYVIKVKTALGAGVLATCTAFSPTGAGTPLIDNNTSTGTITLKTGNAGENNHSFDIGVSEAPPVPKPAGWDFACEDGVMVETVGKSGFSVSNPTANCTGSGTATITLPNGTSADSIYIEAVYKASNPGPSVTFKDAANNNYVAQRYTLPLGDGYVYRTKVPATASISLTDGTKFCALQSLVAYVFRKQAGMASTGVFTCEQGFQNTVTVNIPLPTLTKPADVTVCIPISELTNDGRLLQIKVTAGAIVKDTTITGSDPAFGTCCLAIPKLKLVDVPVGTTTVKVEIISPVSPAGQSFTVASAISANVQCEKCVAPVAAVSPKTQTVCVGGTATAFTATPSTGVEYKWYGPLTSVTASLGTAIAGQTAASFTPTGAALTTEGTKYYAVVVNTTGDATCTDTAFVTLNVSKITVPAATALCHANGTPEDASDDYMTFTIKVTDTLESLHTYTVTATQGGTPLAVTLSNGTPATAVNCGLNTPLRTPAGSAGKGNVTLTITNNVTGCSTTLTITDPGTCAVVCVSGTPSTVVYEYATQTDITELNQLPIIIPQFDNQGGTRVLTAVKLEYTVGGHSGFLYENRAAQAQTFESTATSTARIRLNGNIIATSSLQMLIPETTLPAGIDVPASGSWPGDLVIPGDSPTTLGAMAIWASEYLSLCKDPRLDPRWVTTATGNLANDDDIFINPCISDSKNGSLTYTTAGDLVPFIGSGLVPLNLTTLSGSTLSGGGGNIFSILRTRAYASAKVTYTYECVTLCTSPTRVVTATDPTCTTAGKIEITATNGDKYGVSKGATYTGPAYATATAVGTLPILIKGNISHAADSTWTIRVFNATNDCFKDTTVTVKAAPVKPTITQKSGSPVCRNNGTTYTIKFTATGGTVVTTPTFAVTGDSIANIPIATANVKLVITSAGGCKDSITVTPPNCTTPCVPPTRTVAATDPTCTVAGKIELTATNGDKYGVSKGATYTGPAYATATAVGTLPVLIKGNISHAADSTWTIRVFNADNNCFKDTTVTVKALVKDATISINNGFPVCRLNGTAYTIKFTKSPSGAVVTAKNVATGAAIAVTGDSVANIALTVAQVRLIVTNGVCKDSVDVTAPVCDKPVGSIGDLIWKDSDDNGVQNLPGEKGVAGVKVNLYAAAGGTKTGSVLQTKTTGTDGLYLFTGLMAGAYIVEIDKTSLPDTCEITTKQNIPSDDTKDSDFNPTTGLSQVITLAPVFNPTTPADILATNNLTVDAGLIKLCVKPNAGSDQTLICGTTAPTTVNLVDALAGQKWKVLSVQPNTTVSVTTPAGLVTGMTAPGQYLFVLQTQSDSLACRDTVSITVPDCSCPQVNILSPNATVCKDSLFPTLNIALIGSNTQGVSAAWYANATGGNPLETGFSFKPTGVASVTDTFYVALTGATANCIALPRTPVIVTVRNCTVEVDLALRKSINKKIARIGDELTYTVKVFNQLNTAATGVEVTDSIATTVQFVAGSFVASRGSAVINGNVIKWTIGNIAANAGADGDTVTLTYKVKATQEGVHFNTAEISKTNEKDIDSTPGNGTDGEDDIESQCFTVPFKLCPGEKVQVNVPGFLTNVQWFKNGGTTSVGSGNEILFSEAGSYSYTASNQACPANGCCPVIIEPGDNCCPEDLCIPFTIKKTKKK